MALVRAEACVTGQKPSVDLFRGAMDTLAEPVASFFENVMVMTDDTELRSHRLCLLGRVAQLGLPFGDLLQLRTTSR